MAAARTLFLRHGYGGASMDEVAAVAGVSKQTVYKQFADKKRLFAAVVISDIEETERLSAGMVDALARSDDLPRDLRVFARHHIADVTQPHLLQMRRIIITEAERFPELARTWYANGPERGFATLATQFEALAAQGRLRLDDPMLAAQHFNWLVLSIPLNNAMFHGSDTGFTTDELNRYADEATRVFLAAYGAP